MKDNDIQRVRTFCRNNPEQANELATTLFNAESEVDDDGESIWIERCGHGHWATSGQIEHFAEYVLNTL